MAKDLRQTGAAWRCPFGQRCSAAPGCSGKPGGNSVQIVASLHDMTEPFFVAVKRELDAEAARLGVSISVEDGQVKLGQTDGRYRGRDHRWRPRHHSCAERCERTHSRRRRGDQGRDSHRDLGSQGRQYQRQGPARRGGQCCGWPHHGAVGDRLLSERCAGSADHRTAGIESVHRPHARHQGNLGGCRAEIPNRRGTIGDLEARAGPDRDAERA